MLSQSKSRLIIGIVRLSTSARFCANHYDVLGITPKATQNDIKSAYYKLSKIHHPDKSSGIGVGRHGKLIELVDIQVTDGFQTRTVNEESAKKFRAITEAYEVLGNIKLKKMYDKGLLVGRENSSRMEYHPEPEPTDPTLRFYKSHSQRQVTPTMDGKTPIYNFDAWAKNHYGDLFQKNKYDKENLRKRRAKEEDTVESNRQEALLYLIFALGGLFIVLVTHGTTDYDLDVTRKEAAHERNHTTD